VARVLFRQLGISHVTPLLPGALLLQPVQLKLFRVSQVLTRVSPDRLRAWKPQSVVSLTWLEHLPSNPAQRVTPATLEQFLAFQYQQSGVQLEIIRKPETLLAPQLPQADLFLPSVQHQQLHVRLVPTKT
jgi:hypothetical protein